MNFWSELKKPILCLAPMSDVTDAAFRYILAKYSKFPFVTFTEFVSADGLVLAPERGRQKLLKNLEYSEIERPIVAQIFGSNPENIKKAAKLVAELNFDGLDLNMGCPDKNVEKQGAGAALMKDSKLAKKIIAAAKTGVDKKIPVSVKTRLGYNRDELEIWLPELLSEKPAAIIIHARTVKDGYKTPARWKRIKKAVEIRNKSETLIIGNGDVKNVTVAKQKCVETGADGAMLGRAVIGNPWIFADYEPPVRERLEILLEHIKIFEEKFNPPAGGKNFAVLKKHFKNYLTGVSQLKELKEAIMSSQTAKEAIAMVEKFLM